ncbi:MAG: AAA family ATPase, partial [Bacteroidales bacterium]|nr:AAA family ATPase [Bacteroidales bacterium]
MKRDIDEVFRSWKNETNRYPLLVRGARQVGKSYSIKKFGENEFDNMVEVNFEQKPQYNTCFDTLEPKKIIENLSVLSKSNIIPGKTLLFFDEIQECPNAISALRYFYEQMPELHVIGAGSLLEFAISQEDFRMPVG